MGISRGLFWCPESVGPNWETIKKPERPEKEDDAEGNGGKGLLGEAEGVQYSPAIAQ